MSTIDHIGTVQLSPCTEATPDTTFITVRGGGQLGWYGPVTAQIAAYARDVLAPAVLGLAAEEHEDLHRKLMRAAGPGAGLRASWAVGAIDCAVWDLHARITDRTVAELLGPDTPLQRVPAYASWLTEELTDPEADPELIRRTAGDGWLFTKWGLRSQPRRGESASAERLAAAVSWAAEAAQAPVAVDAVGTWTSALARAFAERADRSALVWLEDPLADDHDPALRCFTEVGLPVAAGERLTAADDPFLVFAAARPAALTLDVVGCGGLTRALTITRCAEAAGIPVYPHGRSLMPALHLAAAFPAAVPGVEYRIQWEPERQCCYEEPLLPEHGHVPLPARPGLGTEPRSASCRSTR